MTNIDHDALARRIAYELSMAAYIDPSGLTFTDVAKLIAQHLREALPTSEDVEDALRDIACYVSAGGYNSAEVNVGQMAAKIKASFDDVHRQVCIKPKILTPEQAGIAKKLVNIPSAVWSETASSLAHHLLRELLEP